MGCTRVAHKELSQNILSPVLKKHGKGAKISLRRETAANANRKSTGPEAEFYSYLAIFQQSSPQMCNIKKYGTINYVLVHSESHFGIQQKLLNVLLMCWKKSAGYSLTISRCVCDADVVRTYGISEVSQMKTLIRTSTRKPQIYCFQFKGTWSHLLLGTLLNRSNVIDLPSILNIKHHSMMYSRKP